MKASDKIRELIDSANRLMTSEVDSANVEFMKWKNRTGSFIDREYEKDSYIYKTFNKLTFEPIAIVRGMDEEDFVLACMADMEKAVALLETMLEDAIEQEAEEVSKSVPEKAACENDSCGVSNNNGTMSHLNKKFQVFISSTYEDLKEERVAVTQCLLDLGCIPVGMEQFPASGMSQMEYIEKMLQSCDYYILILGGRYGSLAPDGIGYTEKEYDYAKSIGLPIMSFVVKDVDKLQRGRCEKTDDGRQKLERFRERVCKNSLVNMYENSLELKAAVAVSMQQCVRDFPAVGWIRADMVKESELPDDSLGKRIDKYLHDNYGEWKGGTY